MIFVDNEQSELLLLSILTVDDSERIFIVKDAPDQWG
jgi:hypothetical protein